MDGKNTNNLFLFFGTLVGVIGLAYLFNNKKRKITFDNEPDGFEQDATNFQKDFQNISGDFHKAKQKCL